MPGMGDRDDLVAEKKIGRDARILYRQRDKGNIDLAVHYLIDQRLARAGADVKLGIGKFLSDPLQDAGQLLPGKFCRRRTYTQTPKLGATKLGDLREGRIVFSKDHSRPVEQIFARLGQDHASRRSRKKLQPYFVLELTYLHRNGRLCDVDTPRPGRK